jgi:hypothetical protein
MKLKPITAEEHNALMERLMHTVQNGEKLNPFEVDIFCMSIRRETKHQFTFCDEYRFRDYYFRDLDYRQVPAYLQMSEAEKQELDEFADDWHNRVVLVTNHSSQTLQHIAKEARKEIKRINKEFSHNGYLIRNILYRHKLRKTMLISRFIHFKILYDYFLGKKKPEISIPSKFGEVIFDDVSLSHIYSRHYAAGEKQYEPDQSFFGPDIHFNSIHRIIRLVLGWISKNNINIVQPVNKAISFKYKGIYYHLYLENAIIQRKGHKGNISILRVSSLFPLNNPDLINTMAALTSHIVSTDLVIYEQ